MERTRGGDRQRANGGGAGGGALLSPLRRRDLLRAGAVALAPRPAEPNWAAAIAARCVPGGLIRSYDVTDGGTDFDRTHANCAYVYDNAVAGFALLAAGEAARARAIARALAQRQAHDRFWEDGRLRNAYAAGPPREVTARLPGWWDASAKRWSEDSYQVGTATGVVAWAMLLWIACGEREAAERAADWVERSVRTSNGYAGGVFGWEPAPRKLSWISTEHNLDLAVAFRALGRAGAADHASAFVRRMWSPEQKRFFSGLTPDGSVNTHFALDANCWPLLAPGADPAWRSAFETVLARAGVAGGVGFTENGGGAWLEGTAIAAATAGVLGESAPRETFLDTLGRQTSASGFIWAASTDRLRTGLTTGLDSSAPAFVYYRRPALAPTAWAVLAERRCNPFRMV